MKVERDIELVAKDKELAASHKEWEEKEETLREMIEQWVVQISKWSKEMTSLRKKVKGLKEDLTATCLGEAHLEWELRGAYHQLKGIIDKLDKAKASNLALENKVQELESSMDMLAVEKAHETLYAFWYHFLDLDFDKVDSTYGVQIEEWEAVKVAKEATGEGVTVNFFTIVFGEEPSISSASEEVVVKEGLTPQSPSLLSMMSLTRLNPKCRVC